MPCFICKRVLDKPEWQLMPFRFSLHDFMPQDIEKATWSEGFWWYFVCRKCQHKHRIYDVESWIKRHIKRSTGKSDEEDSEGTYLGSSTPVSDADTTMTTLQ